MKNYLFNYTEQNPLIINDYPYGFKLRCTIKYWIETAPKKGDRFCSQTIDPRNGRANKPKKSTFSCIGVMFNDENGHTHWEGLSIYSGREASAKFIEEIGGVEKLNPEQKKMYNQLMGINEVKRDEFTDKVLKDYSVKWEKDGNGKCDEVRITFDRPDGVKPREVFEAMKTLNQEKLNQVFEIRESKFMGNYPGTVRICFRGGVQIATVGEEEYKNYISSDANVIREEENV